MPDEVIAEFTHQAAAFDRAAVYRTEETLKRLIELLPLDRRDTWLDVACGTGIVTLALAARVARAIGLDMTPAMLERARAAAGPAPAEFVEGSAEALPFPDASFAGAVTRFSFHHMPLPARVLAEMARVVRPGGWVAAADHLTSDQAPAALWHQGIERLRDPSHWTCLPASAFFALGTPLGLSLLRRQEIAFDLDFEEWLARGSGGPDHRREIAALLAAPPPDAAEAMWVADGRLHYRLGIALWRRPESDPTKE